MLRTYHRSDHLRVTSRRTCAPPCTLMGATRSAYTGFSLFTSEIAKTHRNVLKSKCLSSGQTNMKTISQLWNSQSTSIRLSYKNTAATKAKIAAFDPSRRYNKFNMVMKVLGSTSVSPSRAADSNQKVNSLFHLLGGGAFATKVAKQTALCMQEKHTRKALLRFMPNAKQQSTSSGSVDDRRPNRYKYYYCPPMKYFTSFTEMQRCVAPTRIEVYASVMGLAMNNMRTRQGQQFLHQRFHQLSPEELRVFNPISDEEAPRFEKMCGRHSGGWNHDEFEIMRHFCRFRGIACVAHTPPTVAPSAIELFKAIFSADRLHDSIFLKVRRCLEQASARRSSDCSAFLYKRYVSKPGSTSGEMAVVPPSMYSIQSSMSDVKVATMLQETRMNQSVYDDILERASMFRSANQNTILDNLYNPSISSAAPMSLIKSTMSTTARQIARLRVRVAAQLAKASAHVPEKKMAKVTTTRKKRAVMPSKQQSVAVASIQRELKPSPAVVQLSARKETAQGKVTAVRRPSSTTSSAVAHREASPRKLEKTLRANRSPQRRVQQRLLRMKKVLRASPRGTVHRVRSAVKVPTTPSIRAAPSSTAKADPTKLVAQIQSQLAALMG